jgi:hypothetical protein
MQEEANPVGNPQIPESGSKGDQMIVMDPDKVVGAQKRLEGSRKPLINTEIPVRVLPFDMQEIKPEMADRPKSAVGEACVVGVELSL